MGAINPELLVDRIYEAAVVPELWPSVLRELGLFAGAVGSILSMYGPHLEGAVASESMAALVGQYMAGWNDRNTRAPRLLAARHPGFIREDDVFGPGEWEKDDNFNDLLKPLGLGWAAATAIFAPSGESLVFSIERAFERGPVERETIVRLDGLRPHLARAALLTARLGLEKARAATEALGAVGLPAAVISRGKTILAANELLAEMIPGTIRDGRDRARLADRQADTLLAEALERVAAPSAQRLQPAHVQSIPVPATELERGMIFHLLPLCGNARDLFAGVLALLVVTKAAATKVPHANLIEALFDLTPAEARVAKRIAQGDAPAEIAGATGLSIHTVRSQLKSVLAKTGTDRQADLVRLLAGVGLPATEISPI